MWSLAGGPYSLLLVWRALAPGGTCCTLSPLSEALETSKQPPHTLNHGINDEWSPGSTLTWRSECILTPHSKASVTRQQLPHTPKHPPWHLQTPKTWLHLYLEKLQSYISTYQSHIHACTWMKSVHLSHKPHLHQTEKEGPSEAQVPPALPALEEEMGR